MGITDTAAVADALFAAIEAADIGAVRELYAPDVVVWHNTDGAEEGIDRNLAVLTWCTTHIRHMRYEDVRRTVTPEGFVQQHVLRGTAPNGAALEVPACLVVRVDAGRITRIDEYLDSAQIAILTAAR